MKSTVAIRELLGRNDPLILKAFAFASVFSVSIAVLLTRIMGLGPRVMGDELTYSTFSRLLPISESPVPNYFYLWIFSSTNLCGPEFYSCARLLNVGFVLLTALMVYLIARKMLGFGVSLLFAGFTIAGPTSMYAAHFMPETMFYAGTVFFIWLLLRFTENKPTIGTLLFLGLAVGILSLVKPHGLFLLATIPATTMLFEKGIRDKLRAAILGATVSSFGALIVKLGIGFLIAGEKGLALFRSAYGSFVPAVRGASERIETGVIGSLFGTATQFQSLLMASAVLFLVPIAATILGAVKTEKVVSVERRLALTILVLHLVFLVVVSLFVAQLVSLDPSQELRSQLRYFEFLFLLYPISALAYLKTKHRQTSVVAWFILVGISFLAFIWWFEYSEKFVHVYSDGTFLPMLARFDGWGAPVAIICLALALLFGINRDWAIRGWSFGLLPILVAISVPAMYLDDSIRSNSKPTHLVAAEFTRGTLTEMDLNQLVVIGENRQEVDAARFVLTNPNVKKRLADDLINFDLESLPQEFGWVLVLGQQSEIGYPLQVYEGNGFHLVRRDSGNLTFFDLDEPGRAVIDFLNMENRGTLGAWTVSDVAAIGLLDSPLPGTRIKIQLEATRNLLGAEIIFRLGSEEISVPVSSVGTPFIVDLGFDNPDLARELFVEIPINRLQAGEKTGLHFTYLELFK